MARPSKYPPKEKVCPVCKKIWIARTAPQIENQFLCSAECRTVWNANKRRMRKKVRLCKQCGEPVYYLPCHEKTKWFCSRRCSSLYHCKGENNPAWKGGDKLGKYWKRKARERDKFTCQYPGCGKMQSGKNMHVHHKIPAIIGGEHTLDNLITICHKHHRLVERRLFFLLMKLYPDSAKAIWETIYQEILGKPSEGVNLIYEMGKIRRGSQNPAWEGGTGINGRYWKRRARERDDYACRYPDCTKRYPENRIHAHHKIPPSIGGTHDLENLITLCDRHHRLLENKVFKTLVQAHPDSARSILLTIYQNPLTPKSQPKRFPILSG